MNYRMIGFAIGRILLVEAALLLLPMAVALGYGESPVPYLLPAALLVLCGGLLSFKKPRQASLFARDGLAVVALAWIAVSLFGALPFYISGSIESFVDCFFETVSGFTTTGATILTEVESLNRGILFWRSFTHWVGGMGVLVFVMAILPMGGDGHGMHMLRAEMPGPAVGKLVSRMSDTAKILYGIYLVMTVIEIVLLLAGGMPLFDACIHSFGSAGTGGFSSRNLSVGAYNNPYFEIVIGISICITSCWCGGSGTCSGPRSCGPMSSLWRRQWLPSPWISCTCTSRWAPACGTRFSRCPPSSPPPVMPRWISTPGPPFQRPFWWR